MNFFLSFVSHYWGLLVTLFCCGSLCAYIVRVMLAAKQSDWKQEAKQRNPNTSTTNMLMDQSTVTVKTSTIAKILIILTVALSAGGYAAGTHLQSKRDARAIAERYAKYDVEHAAWLEGHKKHETAMREWEEQNKLAKGKKHAGHANTSSSTGTTTANPAASEPITIRRPWISTIASSSR